MKRPLLIVWLAFMAFSAGVWAASPVIWQVSTQAELLEGEVENLSIDSSGRLLLAPATELVEETTAPFLWTMLRARDGSIYLGSGNEGKVFRIPPGSGKAALFYDSAELEVHAIAQGPDGAIYVGTSPDGKIYKVDAFGTATPFFDPTDKYIWSLVFDKSGTLYAGTGDKGVVYKIGPDGKGAPFYKTETTHAVSLAFDRSGNLIVGTESPGKIFRVDPQAKAFVLLDSSFREIHALRFDEKGTLYAAAVSSRPASHEGGPPPPAAPEPPRPPQPSVSTEITSISIASVAVPSAGEQRPGPRADRRSPKGAIYRISPDGVWDIIWESRDDTPYDVAFDTTGGVLIATGNEGKIFRIAGDPAQVTLLTRASAQQVTMFLADSGGRHLYTTANPGKVFRLGSGRGEKGTYQSKVRDAATVAAWGTISWRGTAAAGNTIELFTRTGNTATPDSTWSDWAGPYKNPIGEQISSPKARYLQWKAVLTGKGDGPVLTSVTAAFLPRNLRPKVNEITVHPPGTVFQKPFSTGELEIAGLPEEAASTRPSAPPPPQGQPQPGGGAPALGRRVYQKGLQTFVWKAEDENDDTLVFDILYRREGETSWKTLKRGLTDPIFVWDTTSVPNGTYFIKIQASDAPSNPAGVALVGELESTSFDIDNTPPTVTMLGVKQQGNRYVLSFEVRDEQSAVQRVEYSLDADRWQRIYPRDGIADSRVEQFDLELGPEAASKSVVIRVVDAMNNVATARADVKR